MFGPKDFEDEECTCCGVTPSVHIGHGAFTCQKCWDASWCPKCRYSIHSDLVDGIHVCQPADVLVKRKEESDDENAICEMDYDYIKKMRAEINTLKTENEQLKSQLIARQ